MEIATSLSWQHALLIGTGFTSALAFGISVWLIFKHLLHYNRPNIQKHIVRIIIMIPIYATDSFLSLIWPQHALFFNVARDLYEAYVLFEFFKYLTDCVDGEDNFAEKLEYVPQFKYISPFCCFHIKPGRIFLFRCKQMILQYVYVKIVLTIATFVLELLHLYDEGSFAYNRGYLWITIVYNISIFLSLYFLVLFYEGSKEILAPFQPLAKFLCIKAVIFFAFWQSVLIAILVKFNFLITARPGYSSTEISAVVNNALICIEMFPIAVAFAITFGWDSYKDPSRVPRPANPRMFVDVLKNFGMVANFRDIVIDTKASLQKEPARRIITGDFFDISMEEQKERVVYEGDIKKCGEDLAKIWKRRHVAIISKPAGIMYWTRSPWDPTSKKIPKVRGFAAFNDIHMIYPKRDIAFNVVMKSTRIWRFRCASTAERDEWVEKLRQMMPDLEKEESTEDNSIPMVMLDEDPSDDNDNQFSTISPTFRNEESSDVESDDDMDESDLNETLDVSDKQKPQVPPRPSVLAFLNRGVAKIAEKITPTAPSVPPRTKNTPKKDEHYVVDFDASSIDNLAAARSSAYDHEQSESEEETVNF